MSCAACKNARGYTTRCPYCGEPGDVTREQMRIAKRQADALEKIAESTNTAPRSDLLTWLNAEHLAAQQTYQAERNPYHEGMVDALDRVIARVEKQAPPDLTSLRDICRAMQLTVESADQASRACEFATAADMRARRPFILAMQAEARHWLAKLTRALDALEAGR